MDIRKILAMMLLLVVLGCQPQEKTPVTNDKPVVQANVPTQEGVIRVIQDKEVDPGQAVAVKVYVNLAPSQTYYLFDEAVPQGFIIQGESDGKNHIKQIEIQDAKSKVYEYIVTAPQFPGVYVFDGEYGVEGKDLAKISGDTSITVTGDVPPGISRSFSKTTVAPGESFKLTINVIVAPGQTYYLFDEAVPQGFEVQAEHDTKNHIKEIVIQDAASRTYEYTLKAPLAAGTYTFDGEYAVEGKDLAKITGMTQIVVQ
jgi:hypothetical protein